MRAALTVTSVSHAFLDHVVVHRGVARRRLSFLPNGADLAALRPLPADVAYAQALGVNGRTTFTYAGTHAHYHGLDVIVDAAERLRHRADIVILMVGAGPVRAGLIARATRAGLRNLVFRDSPFEERARLMSITYAALVVLSDMPVARLMRAAKAIPPLACGVPIVHAGEGETASIVVHAGCGVEVAAADPQALAAAIEALADDPARRARMAIQARALAERDFSWTRLVRTWMAQVARIARDEGAGVPQGLPRIVESTAALALLVVASPLLGLAAAAVAITSPGGALFRHRRIGRGGKPFDILKLRTMTAGTGGSPLTAAGDQRVTAVGRVLRRAKLDELPSLWNVVRGDMSLVGPRPEAPEYVVLSDARWQHVLEVRPGITDPMTLQLRNEDALLAGAPDHDRFYRDYLLPYKLDGSRRHLAHRTWRGDVSVLYHTAAAVVWPPRAPAPSVSEIIARVNRLSPER